KSFGAAVALVHRPSPGFMRVTFSTNATSAASGTADGLCATTAATYDFPRLMRHARSQAARPCATALPATVEIDTVKRTARALVARDLISFSSQRFSFGSILARARMARWISFQRDFVRPARIGSRLRSAAA